MDEDKYKIHEEYAAQMEITINNLTPEALESLKTQWANMALGPRRYTVIPMFGTEYSEEPTRTGEELKFWREEIVRLKGLLHDLQRREKSRVVPKAFQSELKSLHRKSDIRKVLKEIGTLETKVKEHPLEILNNLGD